MMMQTSRPDSTQRVIIPINRDLENIVPLFLTNRQTDLQTLGHALAHKDFATIQRLGHRMKGDGGGYGFDRISEIGAALEQAAERHDSSALEASCAQLEDFLARVQVVYI